MLASLENAVQSVPGGRAAILMGFDGIPVEAFNGDGSLDVETVGMELSVVAKEIRKAVELLEAGATEEVMIRSEVMSAVLRTLGEEYFLVLILDPKGNVGKARYVMRSIAPKLTEELV